MYQAWQQGNENYVRDWARFVEWAAYHNNTTSDSVMCDLQKYPWFKWIHEE
jgi:chitodextrinase